MIGRVPPNDMPTEATILGCAMLDAECVEIASDIVAPSDFYSDSHARIWEAVLGLVAQGQPVDITTVRGWLVSAGKLESVGDDFLLELTNTIPNSSHIEGYARRVQELASVRKVIHALHEQAAKGYGPMNDVRAFLDEAESAIAAVTEARSGGDDLVSMQTVVQTVFENIVSMAERKTSMVGHETGLRDLDDFLKGMCPGDLIIVGGRPGMGKAQPLTSAVLTPTGFRLMGDLVVGDLVIGSSGVPTRVVGVYDQGELPVYRVHFSDGASTRCCDEHLWETRSRSERRRGLAPSVRALSEIRQTLRRADSGGRNHSVRYMGPAYFSDERGNNLTPGPAMSPWALGIYLGDGHGGTSVLLSNPEADIRARFAAALDQQDELVSANDVTMRVRRRQRSGPSEMKKALAKLGLDGLRSHEKFIPKEHLYARIPEREALLRGLMDSDGHVAESGTSVEYCTASQQLCHDVEFLVGSLGGRVTWVRRATHYTIDGVRTKARDSYRMTVSFPTGEIVPVSSKKHLRKWKAGPLRVSERFIESVEPAGVEECRCIRVDAADSLYVTDDFICTHNTALAINNIACGIANPKIGGGPLPVIVFSCEMPKEQLVQRTISSESGIDLTKIRSATIHRDEWPQLTASAGALAELPIYFHPVTSADAITVRRQSRRARRKYGQLGCVVVDYLQLMGTSSSGDSRDAQLGEITRGLKQLALELQVPVVLLSQLNRECEKQNDKRPRISHLRECGSIEQDADVILFVYRDEVYDPKSEWKGTAEILVRKARSGPTGMVRLAFNGARTTFGDFDGQHSEEERHGNSNGRAPSDWHDQQP
ncbi:MAG: replicative DNA helicase [Gammaproteobacteria bacterium]|nr:replicative DNA helicase [Gammaproteobacteria bacterium]